MAGNWKQKFHSIINSSGNPILKSDFGKGPRLAEGLDADSSGQSKL